MLPRSGVRARLSLAALAFGLLACSSQPTAPPREGVAAGEARAAEVGASVLRQGGNAVDAAIAVQFALVVTFPNAGNIGGGGFMLIAEPDGTVHALDYREVAPAAAHRDLYLDSDVQVIEGLSLWSQRAAGVPGSVMGMWEAHQKFGSLAWQELLAPAIRLAEQGWPLDEWTARSFAERAAKLERLPEHYRRLSNFAETFHGKAGETFVQPELARSLRRIAAEGPAGFYEGETAALIVREMQRGNGLITLEDLADYRAHWRKPVEGSYRGHRVVSMPPPSSGGIALVQLLNMLEGFEPPPWHSPEHLHLVAEISKRVFADRAMHLGDSDYHDVPVAALIDKAYCRARAQSIRLDTKTEPDAISEGRFEPGNTTHFSVIDRRGMAVANTTTLNDSYGSGLVVSGAGFLLNNEMDDFSAKPGSANYYGVTGAEANRIEPGKRMLSSMSPTMVFRPDGSLWLVLGSRGGPVIITSVFQVISNRIDYGLELDRAVNSPRFHHQWPPPSADADPVRVEEQPEHAMGRSTLEALEARGYTIRAGTRLGVVHAMEQTEEGVTGAADARGVGTVAYARQEQETRRGR